MGKASHIIGYFKKCCNCNKFFEYYSIYLIQTDLRRKDINIKSTCKTGCPQSDNGLLKYTPGNLYEYNFDSIMTVGYGSGLSSETDAISLKLLGNVKLFSEGNCGYTLKLSAVKVTATKESVERKIMQTIQKPVHFIMASGKLESELCADNDDNAYALNIKRAIISLLQSNTEAVSEVDVFGQCETHTSVSKVGSAEIVTKVRNLNTCSYREKISSGIVNGFVNEKAGVKSTTLFKADYAKELKLENGVIENVQLVEEYKVAFVPKDSHDIRAKVMTTLKLKNSNGAPSATPAIGSNAVSIIFQKTEDYASKNIAALKVAMTELVKLLDNYVHKDSAKGFVELIRIMRSADSETLLELAAFPNPNKVLARKVYLDALFRTGTAESAKAILKQFNKMEEKEKILAILSLNLIQNVDKDTINQASALLTSNSPKELFLAVGTIVSKYCNINGCEQNDVSAISKKFTDLLKHCKANTKKDEERIISVLKGIANTHYLANNFGYVLTECVAAGHLNRVRVAALKAFSAANCDAALQKTAISLLSDRNEDSELRIEAYLVAINCPTAEVANEIAEIVNSETVYQVGGFISSNLKAIRDSTDAKREHQRYYLGNIRVTKNFPKDLRRYSFNNELSYNLDAIGVSASAEYNLIYSQHGFLPRSACLNFSTEVFGTNFNVFEAGIRQENIENILEYYVGPKGLLNKDFDDIMKVIEVGNSGAGGRARRSISDDTAKFAKKYKTYGSKNAQDVSLDLSLKLFGSEIMFLSLGDNIPSSLDDIIKQFSLAFDEVKKQASSFSKEFVVHNLFMDVEVMYPTGAGIPLELTSQGFAATQVDFGVNVDIDSILESNWQRTQYRFKLVPSVDVNINVDLGFNAYVLSTGMRVAASMHSATGSDVSFAFIKKGVGFNMDIELPRKKIELIDLQINPEFYISEPDKTTTSIALKDSRKHKPENNENCFNQLESVGLNFCCISSITNPANGGKYPDSIDGFHLVRPFSFALFVTAERKYNIKGYQVPLTDSGTQQWKLEFSTPESKQSHDTSLSLELGTKERTYARASFDNPSYHFALEAGINNDNSELVFYGLYENNGDIKKNRIGFVKIGNEYRPVIEIQDKDGTINNINGYHVEGKVVVQKIGEKQAKYNFENFQVINKDNERVVVNGWTDVGPSSFVSELHVTPGHQSYFVKSNFKFENGECDFGYFVNDEKTPDNIYGGAAHVKIGQQAYNMRLIGKAASWEADSAYEIEYVMPVNSNIIISSYFKTELALKHKQKQFGSFKLTGATDTNKLKVDAELVRDKKFVALTVNFNKNQRSQGDYVLEVNGKVNKNFFDLMAKCDINGNHFVIDNVLTTSWGTSLTAKGELGQRYTAQDVYIDLVGTAQFNGNDKPAQWTVKVFGAPEKTNSEFKLLRENIDLIKYSGEMQHPQDKVTNGKINMVVKNVLTGKVEFKMARNGKGEFTSTFETQKTEEKYKIDINSKFHIQSPKYEIETTITFDAGKKIYFKTENVLDKAKFSTKNVVDTDHKHISFDANGFVKGDWRLNGDLQCNFILKCPSGHVVDGSIKRKITTAPKTGITQGNMEVQLNDQYDGRKRSIHATAKIDKLNWKVKEIVQDSHIVYTDTNNKKVDVAFHIKNVLMGHNKALDVGFTVGGDILKTPVDLSVVVNDYNPKQANYRIEANYGERLSVNVNGKHNLGERGSPAVYEVQGNLNMPETTFKIIEINSNGKLLIPETEDGGTTVIELHINEKTENDHFLKFNTGWKSGRIHGAYNLDIETKEMQGPLKLGGSYEREQQRSLKEATSSGKHKYVFNFDYAGQYIKSTGDAGYVADNTLNMRYTLDSSFESARNVELTVNGQKLDSGSYALQVQAKNGAHVYNIDSKIFRSTHKKGLDLRAVFPNGKPLVLVGVFEVLGERKAKLTIEVENLAELDLTVNVEASYKNVDDFYVLGQWKSAKLKLDNYDLVVRSQNKAVTFNMKNAQGVIFAGSATYALKKEKNKVIIEGQGQVQILDKSQNTNFRLIQQVYDITVDKEIGFSYTFNGNFGLKNGVSTLKITNKDFNVKLSVCEEKKQCTNVQVQSIATISEQDLDSTQHSLLVLIDLRELGYPYEFEFQSKTIRQGFQFQYSLDSNIISNNNMKYQLVANILPTSSKIQLTLPNRELLLESKQQYPQHGTIFGHYEHSTAFYFDKVNKPNDVTQLSYSADVTGVKYSVINVKTELKFKHQSIRPITISGKFDANQQQYVIDAEAIFDIFRVPEQQIIVSSHLKKTDSSRGFNVTAKHVVSSSGLGFQYELNGHTALNVEDQEYSISANVNSGSSDMKAGFYVSGNKDNIETSIIAMNEQIVQLVGEFNRQKYSAKFDTKLQIFNSKPVELGVDLHPSMAKFSVKRQGLLEANGEIKLSKEVKFNIDGAGKQLINGRVALDSVNFLQTTYSSNKDDIKAFLKTVEDEVKKDTEVTTEKINIRFQKLREIIDQQVGLAKNSVPDFTKFKANYENSVNDIIKELERDPALKQITDSYINIYNKIAKIAGDIAKTSAESYENLHKSFVSLFEKWEVVLKDTVIPSWEEFLVSATQIIGALRVEIVNLFTNLVHSVLSILEMYGPALKNYGKAINDAIKPFTEVAQEFFKFFARVSEEFISELKEYISKLPTFNVIRAEFKEKIEKMKLIEKTLEIINNVFDQLDILPQTPETAEFLQKVHKYVQAKLKQQQVNDEQIIQELFKLLLKAVRSIWTSLEISTPAGTFGLSSDILNTFFTTISTPTDFFTKLPSIHSLRFSVLNFILNENWENIFSMDHFKSWIFFNEFDLKGHIADGRHIFTFDGQYISFPGSCKYILAQDSVDNNFTVIAQLNNGKLKSIILIDRDDNFMEVTDTGVLKLKGNPVEYPQHVDGMHAWRLYYTAWLRSEYGVEVMCTSDLKVCHVNVNGFYTSKTRGLLGNGNAEPNDDLIQFDGTIALDSATFGNGYGLGKCNAVSYGPTDKIKHTELCNEIFGFQSPLTMGYLFLNSAPYREACDVAVTTAAEKDKEAVACTVATAYASALKLTHHFIRLPTSCLKCVGVSGQKEIGQDFVVKVPNNKADVVFVVDVDVSPVLLKNLIAPAIIEVRETLKVRGFTDVQVGVIAYNESQLYPALVTSDNGKLNYQGKIDELELNGPKTFCLSCLSQVVDQKVRNIYGLVERFVKSIETQSDERAFRMALNYPFRAGAAKSIVGVRSNTLEFGNLFKLVLAHFTGAVTHFDAALLHLIAPVKDMSLDGVPSEKLVGFNSRLIATLDGKDAKKRQKLQFQNDMGIDFVLDNGGWVFATQNFDNLKQADQKKTLNQVTNSIADSLFKTEIVSDCECVVVHGLHAQHKCSIQSSTFVPNKKSKAT